MKVKMPEGGGETATAIAMLLGLAFGGCFVYGGASEWANEQAGLATPTPESTATPTPISESGSITMVSDESLISWVEWE